MKSLGSDGARAYGRAQPAELIAWALALDERDGLEVRDRIRLDREIRARMPDEVGSGVLRFWLAEAPSEGLRARVGRVRTSLSLLRWLLLGAGVFFGWAAAAALLQFEVHAGRINIVLCVGLLVALPLGLLVFACLGALWSGRESAQERVATRGLAGGWRSLALARLAMSLLSTSVRPDVERVLGRMSAQARLYRGVQRAQLFVWSQWVGLAFSLGALLATLSFVVFTDLAFGWSTTLDVEASTVHRLVRLLSAPWASLWPAAAPPLDLVETTRHFRVGGEDHIHFVDPIRYGGWWPFLVACVVFYGVVPRLAAVGLGSHWLGREVGRAILRTPGVDILLGALTTPIVESQATGPEGAIGRAERGLVPVVDVKDWIRERGGVAPMAIRWAEASSDEVLVDVLETPGLQVRDAGGRRTLAQDGEILAAAAAEESGVILCVRGYEPPVLDVVDFLADLRRAVGEERGLCVLLLEGDESDHEAWRNKLMGLGDPVLRVALLGSPGSARHDPSGPLGAAGYGRNNIMGGSSRSASSRQASSRDE